MTQQDFIESARAEPSVAFRMWQEFTFSVEREVADWEYLRRRPVAILVLNVLVAAAVVLAGLGSLDGG